MAPHPFLDWPGPIAFAHRGGTSAAPENTMPAFEYAVSLGFRYLETDVHLTADGALVAFHDADLARTCGLDRAIADLTVDEITDLRVDGEAAIPLMRDLFARFPDARFNIDCKSDGAVDALVALVREHDAIERVCLGAFSHQRLVRLRRALGPELLTCMSPREVASLRLTGRIVAPPAVGAVVAQTPAAQVPVRYGPSPGIPVITERFVRAAHRVGAAVHVWTIDDAPEMRRLLDLGVDGIMTDRPEVLRSVMIERGAWPTGT